MATKTKRRHRPVTDRTLAEPRAPLPVTPVTAAPAIVSHPTPVPRQPALSPGGPDIVAPKGPPKRGQLLELGVTGTPVFGGWIMADPNAELQFPRSVTIYDRMRRTDGQVKASILAITLPILSVEWTVEPFREKDESTGKFKEPTPEDAKIAEFLRRDLIDDARGSPWKQVLREALGMLWAGFWILEPVFEVGEDGLVHLAKLASRLPSSVYFWKVARNGDLIGIQQRAVNPETGHQEIIPINGEDLLVFTHDKEGADWAGLALPLETEVPTPSGWRTMGELEVGDQVFDEHGRPTLVVATSPVWKTRPCYRVTFDDGAAVVADENHQWASYTYKARHAREDMEPEIVSTKQMAETLRYSTQGALNHAIKLCGPVQYPKAELPVDPYVLGAWLGDGDRNSGRIVDAGGGVVNELRRHGFDVRRHRPDKDHAWWICGLTARLRTAGVLQNKHIPASYLTAALSQRLELLRGLMDTDGTVEPPSAGRQRRCMFANTNRRLVDGIVALLWSLGVKPRVQYVPQAGHRAVMHDGATIESRRDIYRVQFQTDLDVFTDPVKLAKQREGVPRTIRTTMRRVVSVDRVDDQDTVCIEVSAPSHQFLVTERFVSTRNSVLRSAYKHFYMKDWLYRIGVINVERGGGFPVISLPENAEDADMAAAKKVGESVHMHERAYVIEPFEWKFRLEPGTARIGDVMQQVAHHDEKISANILAQFMSFGGAERAATSEFVELFLMAEEAVIGNVESTLNRGLIRRWVDYNWRVTGYPEVKAQNVRGFNVRRLGIMLRALADGSLITPDNRLETFLRESMGLPDADEETRREPKPTPGFGAPPGGAKKAGPFDPNDPLAGLKIPTAEDVVSAQDGDNVRDPRAKTGTDAAEAALAEPVTYAAETAAIAASKKTAAARASHPFTAAQWTHPNGHPRCRLCGGEARAGGQCPGVGGRSRPPSAAELLERPWTPKRELRGLEQHVALVEIDRETKTEAKALLAKVAPIQRVQVSAVASAAARAERVASLRVPYVGRLAGELRAAMQRVYRFGRQQVRDELIRQAPAKRAVYQLADPIETHQEVMAFLEDKADVLAERWATKLKEAAAIVAFRAKRSGQDVKQTEDEAQSVVGAVADSAAAGMVLGALLTAFGLGRRTEAARQPERIRQAQYSAVMDDGTCSVCSELDGVTGDWDDPAIQAPNPECLGERHGNTCRCVLIYEPA